MPMWNASYCWAGAGALSAFLLVFLNPAVEALTSRRRDVVARGVRIALYLLVPPLAVLPSLVFLVAGAEPGGGIWLFLYVVFFVLFCYHLGKRIGLVQGEGRIRELVGLDTAENVEDAQDRLFESRMRFPARADVVKSIGEMAKKREMEVRAAEKRSVGRPPPPAIDLTSPLNEDDARP